MYERGLVDYVEFLNKTKKNELIHEEIIAFESEDTDRKISLEVAMQWTNGYTESVHTYANTINTHEGGTHEEGFRAALTTLVNKYAREKQHPQGEGREPLRRRRARGSHRGDLGQARRAAVRGPDQDQARQHRGEVVRAAGRRPAARRLVRPQPDAGARHRAQGAAGSRRTDRRTQGARADAAQGPARVAGHARQAQRLLEQRPVAVSEIFIVEGDSAGGSAVQGRNPESQAILPLRGKILNVEKARLDRALANNEVQAMITAFGAGIGEDFDPDKARYHKIVLMADADVDGQHITTLILTLLFRYMRPLIEHGYVYLAQPPLYRLKWTNAEHQYVYSDRERDALLRGWRGRRQADPEGERHPALQGSRRDGLQGAVGDHDGPGDPHALQVTLDDAAAADEIFSTLMGEDVESRRNFIQRNAKDVRFLDI